VAEEDIEEPGAEGGAVAPVAQPSLLRYLPIVLVILLLQAGGFYFVIDYYLFPEEGVSAVQDEEGRERIRFPEGTEPEGGSIWGSLLPTQGEAVHGCSSTRRSPSV
jgi:hypothetical protein